MGEDINRFSLLLVDDEPPIINLLENTFEEENYQIYTSSNGREAIEFLKKGSERPDIITCDIQMPIMNGFETIEHIMAYDPIPILIVTILNKDENFMKALKLGALDIIRPCIYS